MIRLAGRLRRATRGNAAVQFALSIPVFVLFIAGIAQVSALYAAYAGMQQALGEGARYATLYPRPTDDAIRTRMTATRFALKSSYLSSSLTHGTANSVPYVDIQLTYTPPVNFVFFQIPSVTLTKTRRAYLY